MRKIVFLNERDTGYVKQTIMQNGYSLTKQGQFDPEMLLAKGTNTIKSTLGLDLTTWVLLVLTLPLGGLGALPSIIVSRVRKNNNLERFNSDQYKELREYIEKDRAVMDILKKIKRELMEDKPSAKTLKDLNADLKVELRRVKKEYKNSMINEQFESILDLDILD